MPKALLLENIHPDAAKSLRDHGFEVETMKGALSEDELIDALDGVDLVGVRSKTNVTARVLDARPTLSAIGCFCIGTYPLGYLHAGKCHRLQSVHKERLRRNNNREIGRAHV